MGEKRHAGFTLIEILVVMAVISVLMGFGIGMFQRISSVGKARQARNSLIEMIRKVKASSRSWPAALVVDPTTNEIYGLEFLTVNSSCFEPDPGSEEGGSTVPGIAFKTGRLTGGELKGFPFGHTGGALDCGMGAQVDFGNFPDYNLTEGVNIDIWVYPTENRSMGVIEKGTSYGIRLKRGTNGPIVEGFLHLAEIEPSGKPKSASKEQYEVSSQQLALNRWNRIVMNYDRLWVTISIDSWGHGAVKRFEKEEHRVIFPDEDASLVIGGKAGLFVGRVDDMKVAGILSGEPDKLPDDVMVEGESRRVIHFLDGKLDPRYHSVAEEIVLVYEGVRNPIAIGLLGNILVE